MSVVVRMEMPESCKKCKSTLCLWTIADCEIMDTIAAVQDFRKENDDGFPEFCPIICPLPEGHGRLVDAAVLKNKSMRKPRGVSSYDYGAMATVFMDMINDTPTIVPAERSEP